ncbi:MAG TPA: 2,3-bisphosphoglycerate-independent phosphoglycerate mutase [Halobacteriales archaeon]|nr:2,3-bisphosphoglycerate-independent phosphoglycerate mutase [Halobacteriales archaeon]
MQAALIVLDGWGLADHDHLDAIRSAETPTFDRLRQAGAFGTMTAWGRSVGLPEGGMGNSEVGHLTIGAGRVVEQAHTRINAAIDDGSFFENEALVSAFDHAAENGGRVHLAGMVSDAGVHSDQAHLHALIEMAADRGVPAVTHAFTDGRDTAPAVADEYLAELEAVVDDRGTGDVATVSGRYYAMDRDENWERTRQVYDAVVDRVADHRAPSAVAAVEAAHDRGETDEFVAPTLVEGGPALAEGDAVITFNFRADRMRQLVRMLGDVEPVWNEGARVDADPYDLGPTDPPDVHLVTMTDYDETFGFPVAYPAEEPEDTFGAVLSANGLTQLRIAETEKYAHVTYFLNGGREVEFPGEIREIVPSPDVPTYDLQPEMSAPEVTDRAIEIVEERDPDVLVLNYANPDMVGHTGDFEAAVTAVEAVDAQLARLLSVLQAGGAHVVVIADHGNADDMGTAEDPHTAHTFNPVPFVYLAPDGTGGGKCVREGGELSDVAPTLLSLLGIEKPAAMTGENLLV